MNKVIVIGAGFSSLSAACYLAKAGYDVTVLEKNGQPGGRARQLKESGFTFDTGPTWYWMPDVFERFFSDFGKRAADYYNLQRLDPSYRIYFDKKIFIDVPVDEDAQCELFEQFEKGSGQKLRKFLKSAGENYRIAVQNIVYLPGLSPVELISRDTITRLNLFVQSIRSQIRKQFHHPHLIRILEFPVLFLGAKPETTPAFYNFMNYADLALGTWYPGNGMYGVVNAFAELAKELGVKLIMNCNATEIKTENDRAVAVCADKVYESDYVVAGSDYHHTENLLPGNARNYSEKYWSNKTFAPSALLFFIGINKKLENVQHHTLFFDREFDPHAKAIYDDPSWPEDPLFYACIPSLTDDKCAPEGCENITLLIPIAPGIEDNENIRKEYFKRIMKRMEFLTGQEIINNVIYTKSYCINDFISDYNSYKGNAYGLANTLRQTAFLRPSLKNKKIKNLYYTGQLTVPGPGVPPAIISGKIVSELLHSENKKNAYAI